MPAWRPGEREERNLMRYVHAALLAILVLFAALQVNDPDWYYWGPVYLLAAGWSALALWQPGAFARSQVARIGAPVSAVLFLAGFAWLAPNLGPGWIHNEEARESLGYLICAVATAFALWHSRIVAGTPGRAP
jgi:hypothetical protein